MKKSYEIDMCNGPLLGKILVFSVPLMLSGILQLLFNAADIIVVGRFAGSTALAAVGSTASLINLMINVFVGLSVGVNVLAARYYGGQKEKDIQAEVERLEKTNVGANPKTQAFLERHESTALKTGATLAELVRRPELDYFMLTEIDEKRPELSYDTAEQVNINIKYEGYLKRQQQQVAQFKKLEKKKLDPDFDYSTVNSLRREAVQKLNLYKPASIGQASRISGVSPADISVLLVHLEQMRHSK